MATLSPLVIDRLFYEVCNKPHSEHLKTKIHELLCSVINDPDSPFLFSVNFYEIISLASRIYSDDTILNKNINQYNQLQTDVLNKLGVNSLMNLSPDMVGLYYDKVISQYCRLQANASEKYYSTICNYLLERDLALWGITNKLHYIQTDIISSLYSIDPELLTYHDKHKLKHLKDMMKFKFSDHQTIGLWQYNSDKCSGILQSFILENESNGDNDEGDVTPKTMSITESSAYWSIQWWIIYSMFLTGDHALVVESFVNLVTTDRTNKHIIGNSIDALRAIDSEIIDPVSLLRIVSLSTIISQNNIQQDEVFKLIFQSNMFETDKLIKKLRDNIQILEIQGVRDLLQEIRYEIPWIESLSEAFQNYQNVILQKSLITYLSCVEQVTFQEIGETFNVSLEVVETVLVRLLIILDLPFEIDGDLGIVRYNENNVNLLSEHIQNAINKEIIRANKVRLNNIIGSMNEPDRDDSFND